MTTGLRDGTPSEAGLSARLLDHASDLAASWVKDGSHPALVVLIARRGVVALHEAFGRLGPEPGDPPLTRDALFPLASLAKPVTATALMILVEEGRIGLTRRVCDYIPEFDGEGKDAVYVHHLLTHTSGLQSPFDPQVALSELASPHGTAKHEIRHCTRVADAFVQLACERPLGSAPGEQMFYDSLNYDLVGEIVRRASGRSLQDFVHNRIFDPLGMADSYVTVPDEVADRVVRATSESPMAVVWEFPMLHVATGAGAGFHSTALDMAVFGQAFLDLERRAGGARILGRAAMEGMITNQIPGVPGVLIDERHDEASWGYGWGIACHEKWAVLPDPSAGHVPTRGLVGRLPLVRSHQRRRRSILLRRDQGDRAGTNPLGSRPVRQRGNRGHRRLNLHRVARIALPFVSPAPSLACTGRRVHLGRLE